MKDFRRLNVAVTRARRQCTLIGDSETLNSDALLQRLVAHFSEQGEHWSAQEFLPDVRFYSAPPPKKTHNNNNNNTKKKKNNKNKSANQTAAKSQREVTDSNGNNAQNNNQNSKNNSAKNSNSQNSVTEKPSPAVHQPVTQPVPPEVTRVNPPPEVTAASDDESSETEHGAVQSTNQSATNTAPQPSAAKKKKKKKPAAKPTNQSAAKKDKLTNEKESFANMTDDEVLEQALKYKNVCHYPQCEKSVAIVGSVCDHCHYKYCYVSAAPSHLTYHPLTHRSDALPLRDARLRRGCTRISAQGLAQPTAHHGQQAQGLAGKLRAQQTAQKGTARTAV